MRYRYFFSCLLLLGAHRSAGQSTLHFTLLQAPPLVVDAGSDKTIQQGANVVLGGAPTAAGGTGTYSYAWSPAIGLDQANVAHPTASPAVTTVYKLTVSDPGGCQKEARVTVTVATVTGTHLALDPSGLRLFPNPSHGVFTLTSDQPVETGPVHLSVYTPLGQEVYAETFHVRLHLLEQRIQMPPRAEGIYFLRLTGHHLNSVFKLLVQ